MQSYNAFVLTYQKAAFFPAISPKPYTLYDPAAFFNMIVAVGGNDSSQTTEELLEDAINLDD